MTLGSRSTKTALGTCFPAPVSEKKVLKLSSAEPSEVSEGIRPSGWIPCSRQYSSLRYLGNILRGEKHIYIIAPTYFNNEAANMKIYMILWRPLWAILFHPRFGRYYKIPLRTVLWLCCVGLWYFKSNGRAEINVLFILQIFFLLL